MSIIKNDLNNAEALFSDYHSFTNAYGIPGKSPEPFIKDTKDKALKKQIINANVPDSYVQNNRNPTHSVLLFLGIPMVIGSIINKACSLFRNAKIVFKVFLLQHTARKTMHQK